MLHVVGQEEVFCIRTRAGNRIHPPSMSLPCLSALDSSTENFTSDGCDHRTSHSNKSKLFERECSCTIEAWEGAEIRDSGGIISRTLAYYLPFCPKLGKLGQVSSSSKITSLPLRWTTLPTIFPKDTTNSVSFRRGPFIAVAMATSTATLAQVAAEQEPQGSPEAVFPSTMRLDCRNMELSR